MKVTVITGSGHKNGTSALLADSFIRGATEAGHEVYRYDAAFEEVHPCMACDRCYQTGKCVYGGSYEKLIPHLKEADVLVFVTPIYYFGMTAALKAVIDRFHQMGGFPHGNRKAILMATAWDSGKEVMEPLVTHYRAITEYLGWTDAGMVLAYGAGTRNQISRSSYPEQAYRLGRNLR